jgi:phytoene dehydrogenase-like protein
VARFTAVLARVKLSSGPAGDEIAAKHAVLADVPATVLYGGLVAWEHLPPRLRDDLRRFHWDYGTFKVDWALSRPVPWTNPEVANAGTVHIADGMNAMSEYTSQLSMGRIPAHPFVLLGQMTTCDPSRSPIGTESLWGYTHVPRRVAGDAGGKLLGLWDDTERQCFADRLEDEIQRFAPGFRDRIIARRINSPMQLAQHNASLVGGAINGGTTALHQQLIFRPTPGLGRPETPIAGLYLSSASAHPGGGVHGACGSNAARAALRQARTRTQSLAAAVDRWTIGE